MCGPQSKLLLISFGIKDVPHLPSAFHPSLNPTILWVLTPILEHHFKLQLHCWVFLMFTDNKTSEHLATLLVPLQFGLNYGNY